MDKNPIMKVTDRAVGRIRELIKKRNKPTFGIRVGIKSGGCSGMSYTVEYSDEKKQYDEVIEQEDVRILIDGKAVIYLIGCEMDYVEEKLKSGFTFSNPNAKNTCGCGESFNA